MYQALALVLPIGLRLFQKPQRFKFQRHRTWKARAMQKYLPCASVAAAPAEPVVQHSPVAKISEQDVKKAQAAWASAIKSISKTYLDGGDYVAAAAKAAGELYGYGHTDVLFKPTKAAEVPFRPTAGDAMSYFVGHGAVKNGYAEDAGFAINGGKGWSDVVFRNHQVDVSGNVAIAMGNYFFTSAADGSKTRLNTRSATRRMRTARCASSCITRQCPLLLQLQRFPRKR